MPLLSGQNITDQIKRVIVKKRALITNGNF